MTHPHRELRVLVVEDDRWVRESLTFILGSRLAASCTTGHQALLEIDGGLDFNVALVDLGLPDCRGSDLIATLRRKRPDVAAVVFTIQDDEPSILEAIVAGAQGYLLKSAPPERILDSLRDASQGGAPMTPSVARMVLDALRSQQLVAKPDDDCFHTLTDREREVLKMLAKGLTYKETASTLGIGLGTVQSHVKHIYGKLQVTTKAEAATLAQRMGLV